MNNLVLYIHGKDGNAEEANHYKTFFRKHYIIGFDYNAKTPWKAKDEFCSFIAPLSEHYGRITLIANSIGAYFAMNAEIDSLIEKAYFISPIIDMEKLIFDMMEQVNVTESTLKKKNVIHTDFGEDLSWEYLSYVRTHPIQWKAPTEILYGSEDHLTSLETISTFSLKSNVHLTIMQGGEHYFHTDEQMKFLDQWIQRNL